MTDRVGVVIGRFQIDDLHEGHLSLLNHVKERHSSFLVLLGVRIGPTTKNNPINYRLREQMIKSLFPEAVVLPVLDCGSDDLWSSRVDAQIETAFPVKKAIIYGGQGHSLSVYTGKHEVKEVDTTISSERATQRREEIAETPLNTSDFRAGIIYALHTQYPRTEISVDIAGIRLEKDTLHVVIGRKQGEDLYRFPGGFVDPSDENFFMTARREFNEETGLWLNRPFYIQDFTSTDWRSADQQDVTHRTVLIGGYIEELPSRIKAGDDLEEALYYRMADLKEEMFVPEHRPLAKRLIEGWWEKGK